MITVQQLARFLTPDQIAEMPADMRAEVVELRSAPTLLEQDYIRYCHRVASITLMVLNSDLRVTAMALDTREGLIPQSPMILEDWRKEYPKMVWRIVTARTLLGLRPEKKALTDAAACVHRSRGTYAEMVKMRDDIFPARTVGTEIGYPESRRELASAIHRSTLKNEDLEDRMLIVANTQIHSHFVVPAHLDLEVFAVLPWTPQ